MAAAHSTSASAPVKFTSKMRLLHLDSDGRREWLDRDPLRNPMRFLACHWGQLKLLYGEIEFLTLASKDHDLSVCTLVYAGAAPGHSISLLRRMFPTLRFILVDPAKFIARADSHVRILNTLFTDQTVASIVADEEQKGRTILFLSDIRLTVDDAHGFEDAVFADMISQQRWCIDLDAAMGMLKFRLPFPSTNTGKGARDMSYDYRKLRKDRISLRKDVPKKVVSVLPGTLIYLDGEIRLQVYPPSDSAETRLIVKRSRAGKFMLRSYDYLTYEQTMVHFNTVGRRAPYVFSHSALLGTHIAGFDTSSYECASEAWIVSEYVRMFLKPSVREFAQIVVRVLYSIHHDMWQVTHKSIITCKLGTPVATSGLERVIARLVSEGIESVQSISKTVDKVAEAIVERAKAQIVTFTSLASQPQTQTQALVLRRTDYLAQITWLRSEIEQVRRLHTAYSDILSRRRRG